MQYFYEEDAHLEAYLYAKGEAYQSYFYFGAHIVEESGRILTRFRVYAPRAKEVRLVGGFCDWHSGFPMKRISENGIYSITLDFDARGYSYKYAITSEFGQKHLKADPYGFFAELRPNTASIVYQLEGYPWGDAIHMASREEPKTNTVPMLVYEVHLGSWQLDNQGNFMNYREIAHRLVPYVRELGYTHIELLPVLEHPLDASWGYQVTGFFSATSRFGSPIDLMYLIDQCHQNGIGVLLDWVPCHFCKDAHGLSYFDGSNLYESAYPHVADNPQWGTGNFDLTRTEVWSFLISSAMFWLDQYHIDGLRVDAVAYMIYLDHGQDVQKLNRYGDNKNVEGIHFVRRLNDVIKKSHRGVLMIAEESTDFPLVTGDTQVGGLGFDLKWNMGWMNDTLKFFAYGDDMKRKHLSLMTFSMMYAYDERFVLPLSHDEVVHGKKSLIGRTQGDYWQQFSNLRLLLCYMMTHPGRKLQFMGAELAQFIEWDENKSLDWVLMDYPAHVQHKAFVTALNHFYLEHPALYLLDDEPSGFEWIECDNSTDSVLVYRRMGIISKDELIVVLNLLTPARTDFAIGVPELCTYEEVFNSDQPAFGGSNVINEGVMWALDKPTSRMPYTLLLRVPPLGCSILMKRG